MAVENRRFIEQDKESILKLLTFVNPGGDAESKHARWEWLHRKNPTIPEGIVPAWVSSENGKVKVNVSVFCSRFKLGDRTVPGGWLVDVYRRAGFKGAISLPRLTLKIVRDLDFLAGLGLSEDAVKFARAFKWILPGNVPKYVKLLSTKPIIERKTGKNKLAGLVGPLADAVLRITLRPKKTVREGCYEFTIEQVDEFGPETDRIWNSAAPYFKCVVERKMDYLNWRFVDQPGSRNTIFIFYRKDEPAGYSVLRFTIEDGVDTGIISDLFAAPRDLPHIVAHAVSYFRSKKVAKAVCHCSHPEAIRALEHNGFIQRPSDMIFTYSHLCPTFDVPGISDLKNWYVTASDSDQDRPSV